MQRAARSAAWVSVGTGTGRGPLPHPPHFRFPSPPVTGSRSRFPSPPRYRFPSPITGSRSRFPSPVTGSRYRFPSPRYQFPLPVPLPPLPVPLPPLPVPLPPLPVPGSPPVHAMDKESLLQLRRRTGLPILQCREALQSCGGDLAQAEAWLLEHARRHGWSPRAQERPAREGLVGLIREGHVGVMVEVSCETDFVARTPEFQQVVAQAALGTYGCCQWGGAPTDPPLNTHTHTEPYGCCQWGGAP
uniref:Elongation factor Ts, mitochondrial n=1 Tax=Melopsittacus undulatus TaxID=13146 RepID=A0A8V5GYA3_MELUD